MLAKLAADFRQEIERFQRIFTNGDIFLVNFCLPAKMKKVKPQEAEAKQIEKRRQDKNYDHKELNPFLTQPFIDLLEKGVDMHDFQIISRSLGCILIIGLYHIVVSLNKVPHLSLLILICLSFDYQILLHLHGSRFIITGRGGL